MNTMANVAVFPLEAAEISAFVRLELDAFKSHPRTPMVWRHGYNDELYAYYEQSKAESFEDPESRFVKAVNNETGEIVGVSEWTFALDAEKNASQQPPDPNQQPPSNWPEGGNWELRQFYKMNLFHMLVDFLPGKPYILLDILTVRPELHARGIGSKLLTWGVKQADELGVAMCLESTPAGLALYQKFGFKPVRYIRADMKAFGWDQPYDEEEAKRVFMIREAQIVKS